MVGCSDKIESFYETFDHAKESGAIERGWIPNVLPQSSMNIKEIHDLDTNQVWIRFETQNNESVEFFKKVKRISIKDIKGNMPRDPKVKWWSKTLLDKDLSKYSFYKTSEIVNGFKRDLYFAKENEEDYICCWSNQ